MATASASYRKPLPAQEHVKFDAEFIERRMREHREWQDRLAIELAKEILAEAPEVAWFYRPNLRTR